MAPKTNVMETLQIIAAKNKILAAIIFFLAAIISTLAARILPASKVVPTVVCPIWT